MGVLFFQEVRQGLPSPARKKVDKSEVKPFPVQVMDSCKRVEVQLHPFLTSALDRRDLSALCHGRFSLAKWTYSSLEAG